MGLMVGVFLLTACQAVTGRTLGQNIDDSNLTATVKAQLARERISTLTRIDVDSNGGVVSLNGTVESAEQRIRAEQSHAASAGCDESSIICRFNDSARPRQSNVGPLWTGNR